MRFRNEWEECVLPHVLAAVLTRLGKVRKDSGCVSEPDHWGVCVFVFVCETGDGLVRQLSDGLTSQVNTRRPRDAEKKRGGNGRGRQCGS